MREMNDRLECTVCWMSKIEAKKNIHTIVTDVDKQLLLLSYVYTE